MITSPASVDSYIASLPEDRQIALTSLREIVFDVVPQADESIEYKMPMYKLSGDAICAFASQKHYISLYINPDVVERHRNKLAALSVGKGCIRFKKIQDIPVETLKTLLQDVVESI